jgi:hypothetical protein
MTKRTLANALKTFPFWVRYEFSEGEGTLYLAPVEDYPDGYRLYVSTSYEMLVGLGCDMDKIKIITREIVDKLHHDKTHDGFWNALRVITTREYNQPYYQSEELALRAVAIGAFADEQEGIVQN